MDVAVVRRFSAAVEAVEAVVEAEAEAVSALALDPALG